MPRHSPSASIVKWMNPTGATGSPRSWSRWRRRQACSPAIRCRTPSSSSGLWDSHRGALMTASSGRRPRPSTRCSRVAARSMVASRRGTARSRCRSIACRMSRNGWSRGSGRPPHESSGSPTANACASRWSATSRGVPTTGMTAPATRGWTSTSTCRWGRRTSSIPRPTRPTRATTSSMPGRKRTWSTAGGASSPRSCSSTPRNARSAKGLPTSG
jgi:hypothetical protein